LSAWDHLAVSVIAYFNEKFGGANEAGIAVMRSAFAEEVTKQTGVTLEITPDGQHYLKFPTRESERPFWKGVEAKVGPKSKANALTNADDAAAVEVEPDLSGRPLPALLALEAIKLYSEGATAYRVDQDTALSYRGALRVETWVKGDAVWWDAVERRVRVARGWRLVRQGDGDSATLQLEQV
jgi:hypothetical protein